MTILWKVVHRDGDVLAVADEDPNGRLWVQFLPGSERFVKDADGRPVLINDGKPVGVGDVDSLAGLADLMSADLVRNEL